MTTNPTAYKIQPPVILSGTFVEIPKSEPEHDGIMEQITYEHSGDNGFPGALALADLPWTYVEKFCRL